VLRRIAAIATDVLRPKGAGPGGFEHRLFTRLLDPSTVAIITGDEAEPWRNALREARPEARLLTVQAPDMTALDAYCRAQGVRHIGFLRVSAGDAASVLRGVSGMLGHSRVDLIGVDGVPDPETAHILASHGYEPASAGRPSLFLQQRFRPMLDGAKTMLDIAAECRAHGVQPRGVVHVGAHEGQELELYRRMGLAAILFIEANPAVFARLEANVGAADGVVLANVAITDHVGPVALHVTSGDQSSSILTLHRHATYYPGIVEDAVVEVPGITLDALLAERNLAPASFNLLNIDIQGAELLALKGAEELLRHIAAINVEVNFEELYAGCAQIDELDDFLAARGFRRVATACPFHRSWGDAFYIRGRAAP
jgi:FkbM family methyltransferase